MVLGRLDPDNFLGGEMKLDADGARRGIEEKIAAPLKLDPVAAAQAIVEIAIAKMSLAVREVSVAKGYDPRDFALVASGGAGPLHVVAIARELYIPKVIVPLFPSHFSALGMLLADERHDFIRTFYCDLATVDFARCCRRSITRWSREATRERCAMRRRRERQIHLDLRYVGQEFTLQVPVSVGADRDGRSRRHPDRVRRALRASLRPPFARRAGRDGQYPPCASIGKRPKLAFPRLAERRAARSPRARARSISRDARKASPCPVYQRETLGAGERDRRSRAHSGARHDDASRRTASPSSERSSGGPRDGSLPPAIPAQRKLMPSPVASGAELTMPQMTAALDPVTLEVIRNALPAIANEMAVDLQRTSYNMMIYEVRDFCTALVDTDGELICQNVGGVSHFVADLGVIITDGMKRYGKDGFAPGDVIITNHQAVAGQHLNNIVIYMPYFHDGELLMFAMVRAHWIDVGGMSTGFGAGPTVADPWIEGLQLDQLKIYEAGELNETLYRVIKDNIRFPESSLGDMKSQIAACRLAARRLDELFDKYGRDTVLAAIERIFDETESEMPQRRVAARRRRLRGRGRARRGRRHPRRAGAHPCQGHGRPGAMTIDLSGCSQERRAAINSRTLAGARVAYKALTAPLDPVNEGSFRALEVIIPEGNIMMARFPAPMASWSMIVPTVVDTIVAALAPAMPERVPARPSRPARRRGRVLRRASRDQAALRRAEHRRRRLGRAAVRGRRVRHGLGLPGRRAQRLDRRHRAEMPGAGRGALPARRFRRRRQVSRRARHRHARAQPGRREVEFRAGAPQPLPALGPVGRQARRVRHVSVARSRARANFASWAARIIRCRSRREVIVRTGGGGGWGDPLERDPAAVQVDVREEFISLKSARDDYGVVLRDDLSIDQHRNRRAATCPEIEAMTGEVAIRIRGVSHQFGEEGDARTCARCATLRSTSGAASSLCLIGPSGCGKSTLLNVIGGLMAPTAGDGGGRWASGWLGRCRATSPLCSRRTRCSPGTR